MDKEYTALTGNNDTSTSLILPPTVSKKKGDTYVYDCSCCECVGFLTGILAVLLTFIFGILFIVLSAVGGENTKSKENNCDCTQFTRGLGSGLGISLLLEVGVLLALLALAVGAALCKSKQDKCEKLVQYYSFVAGAFIAVNYICFLCMTIAVIVFVATGRSCCSATSIVVASLSGVLSVVKLVVIFVILCYGYFSN